MDRLKKKFEAAAEAVPAPEIVRRDGAEYGIISLGGCHAAVAEAVDKLAAQGMALDYMRVKAFPFGAAVGDFLRSHERCFVVEQNRDAQLASLLMIETGIPRDRLISVLDYGGLPLTSTVVTAAVSQQLEVHA